MPSRKWDRYFVVNLRGLRMLHIIHVNVQNFLCGCILHPCNKEPGIHNFLRRGLLIRTDALKRTNQCYSLLGSMDSSPFCTTWWSPPVRQHVPVTCHKVLFLPSRRPSKFDVKCRTNLHPNYQHALHPFINHEIFVTDHIQISGPLEIFQR